jgi:hypothetical protein
MKILIGIILVVALFGCGTSHADAPDADQLTQILNEFLAGASVNDLDAHKRFWADDLIYTSSSGERFNKAEILERNAPSPDSGGEQEPEVVYTAENIRIHQYGNTAIVAFRLVATQADPPQVLNYYNTGTFLRRDGLWQAVAWQATRIPGTE